jgi:hypothetical protein
MDIMCFLNTLRKLFQMLYVNMGEPNVKVKVSEPLEVVQFLQKNLKIALNMGECYRFRK